VELTNICSINALKVIPGALLFSHFLLLVNSMESLLPFEHSLDPAALSNYKRKVYSKKPIPENYYDSI
jgi:hypothetical protein